MLSANPHFQNEAQVRKFNILTGIKFANVRPMDIDGFIELRNKVFIFIETKYQNGQMTQAQRTALSRLVDAVHSPPNKYAYLLVASHNDDGVDIDVARSSLEQIYSGGKWFPETQNRNMYQAVEAIIKKHGIEA